MIAFQFLIMLLLEFLLRSREKDFLRFLIYRSCLFKEPGVFDLIRILFYFLFEIAQSNTLKICPPLKILLCLYKLGIIDSLRQFFFSRNIIVFHAPLLSPKCRALHFGFVPGLRLLWLKK